MKNLLCILMFFSLVLTLSSENSLPNVKTKLVVLTRLKNINIHDDLLTLRLKNSEFNLKIDKAWLQHRIWNDGGITVIKDSDPKSAAYRLALVEKAIRSKQKFRVLLEFLKTEKSSKYVVSYIRPVNLKLEFQRYFPETAQNDTIDLPLLSAPKNYKDFGKRLVAISRNSIKKLIKRDRVEESHKYFLEDIEVNKNDYKSFRYSLKKIPDTEMNAEIEEGKNTEYFVKDKQGNIYNVSEEIRRGGNFYSINSAK